jgi:ankyrin repeat protein
MAKIGIVPTIAVVSITLTAIGLLAVGWGTARAILGSSFHQKCGWKAEKYFDDPPVIELCKAIEADDLAEIDRLVAAGANVNAKGKGNMTPLLWAYPDGKVERFTRLLEHGADPNVVIESDFNTRQTMRAGDSVTHLACRDTFDEYFEAVFDHGGDSNLVRKDRIFADDTPLFSVIVGRATNKKERLKLLIDKGANLDHMNGIWTTPTMNALGKGRYDIALMLLEAGADHMIYRPKSNTRLVHVVIGEESSSKIWTPEQKADYEKLVQWLKNHGESFEEARADIARWKSWIRANGEYRRNMDAEIAERVSREAQQQKPGVDTPADKAAEVE